MIHNLKVWPEHFELLRTGSKRFEIRKADRPFEIGHVLSLQEWSPVNLNYSGRQLHFEITCIYQGEQFGIMEGFAVLGISAISTIGRYGSPFARDSRRSEIP